MFVGDHVWANKLAYRFGDLARGDLIVFANPCGPSTDFSERLVGLPGDTVEVRCSVLYVNGRAASQRPAERDCSYWAHDEGGPWRSRTCSR